MRHENILAALGGMR